MSDKVPYHAYEKRGKMIEAKDKRIAELERIEKAARALFESPTQFYWVSPKTWYAHEPEVSNLLGVLGLLREDD